MPTLTMPMISHLFFYAYLWITVPLNPETTPPPPTLTNSSVKIVCHHYYPFTMLGFTQWIDLPYCGSGTVVKQKDGKQIILTCNHVIDDYYDFLEIFYPDNSHTLCHVVARDSVKDIAILVSAKSSLPVLTKGFSATDPTDIDDSVAYWHTGYPGGGDQLVRVGGIYQLHKINIKSKCHPGQMSYTWQAEAYPGDSGSAIFNGKGEIVGMIWGANLLGQSEATGSKDLEDFCLKHCSEFFSRKQP